MIGKAFVRFTGLVAGMLALASLPGSPVRAEQEHSHGDSVPSALAQIVRQVTEPYKDVTAAEAAGYVRRQHLRNPTCWISTSDVEGRHAQSAGP